MIFSVRSMKADTVTCTILIMAMSARRREIAKFLSASAPRKKGLHPSAMARMAKSSDLINKTLELHIMPPTVCRRVAVFLLRSYTNTRILQPFASSFSFANRGCVQKCLDWLQRAHVRSPPSACRSVPLSLFIPLLPLQAGETRVLQPNKGQPSSSPFTVLTLN